MLAFRRVIGVFMAATACSALAMGAASATASASARPHVRPALAPGVISVVAGGVGGPGLATTVALSNINVLSGNCGVTYAAGSLYIGDGNSVRAVSPGSDRLTTPAGTGAPAPLGNGGPAARAGLLGACGVALDGAGNLVIADAGHNQVRVVAGQSGTFYGQAMKAGRIYRIAGLGGSGYSGDGGPATQAKLSGPFSVTLDSAGNVVIADSGNNRIRVVAEHTGTFYGLPMTAGDIYTVAGDGTAGYGGDGGPATSAELFGPQGVAVDRAGNLLIADRSNQRVRVVAASTGTFYGLPMTAGDIYTVAGNGTAGYGGDGGPATGAELDSPVTATPDAAGNLVIADTGNNRVRVVAASTGTFYGLPMTAGDIYTVAGNGIAGYGGDGGPATGAALNGPDGAVIDSAGNLVINDAGNSRVRVVAAATGTFYGQPMTAGDIYTVAGNGKPGFSGDRGPATAAVMDQPYGIALDGSGNTIIADSANNRIRVVAAATGTFYGQAMTAGHIYTVAGNGSGGYSGNGGPARHARLTPLIPAVDAAGNILITTVAGQVRVVAASTGTFYGQAMTAGDIYTIAGPDQVGRDFGIAVDSAGNVVVSDSFGSLVRVIAGSTGTFYGRAMTVGHIYTVAGDGTAGYSGDGIPATQAELSIPWGLAVDAAGNLVFSDSDNQRVRVVAEHTGTFYGQAMTAGDIYTVAGCGDACGSFASGIPATTAQLLDPGALTVDNSGNLILGDMDDGFRLRVVAERTGTFYGQSMIAGDIYTIGGTGHSFPAGGVPAVKAGFSGFGLAVTAAGNLQVSDLPANRILEIGG
jgi:sugar lactone lactonase YvrE